MTSSREFIKKASDGNGMSVVSESGVQYIISKQIPYNEFLKRIMQGTNIPIITIHKAISKYVREHGIIKADYFNEIL